MARIALFVFSLLACLLFAFASPVPVANGELVQLEKRLDHIGRGTWFYPGMGNCGKPNTSNDLILAIGKGLYDRNRGGNCDQWVEIENVVTHQKAYGLTRDSCQSCTDNDIDMSPALFQRLGNLNQGVLQVKWHFMNKAWHP